MTTTEAALAVLLFLGILAILALYGRVIRVGLDLEQIRARLDREEQARIHHVARLARTSTDIVRNLELLAERIGKPAPWRDYFGRN